MLTTPAPAAERQSTTTPTTARRSGNGPDVTRAGDAITALAGATLLVVFLSELAGLVALALWGAQAVTSAAGRWALGIGVPVTAALLWGRYCAPRARVHLPRPAVATIKIAFLAAVTLALVLADHPVWAATLAVLATGSTVLAGRLPNPWENRPMADATRDAQAGRQHPIRSA